MCRFGWRVGSKVSGSKNAAGSRFAEPIQTTIAARYRVLRTLPVVIVVGGHRARIGRLAFVDLSDEFGRVLDETDHRSVRVVPFVVQREDISI